LNILNPRHQIANNKWFDKPFDRLTVLSKVEGLTTLSQPVESLMVERVEGQIPTRGASACAARDQNSKSQTFWTLDIGILNLFVI
jgi:hypothetical protein